MATTPTEISKPARGIVRTLAGYILQNESIKEAPLSEETDDQNGARADEEVYDHRFDLSLTAVSKTSTRTPPAHTDDLIEYAEKKWKVDEIEEAGSYNGKLRFNIRAHRYDNFPAQTPAQSAPAQNSGGENSGGENSGGENSGGENSGTGSGQ